MARRNKGIKPKVSIKEKINKSRIINSEKRHNYRTKEEIEEERNFNFFKNLMQDNLGGKKTYS